jgi:hypothetical protein
MDPDSQYCEHFAQYHWHQGPHTLRGTQKRPTSDRRVKGSNPFGNRDEGYIGADLQSSPLFAQLAY